MSYNETTIIEANYKDRINLDSKSNDFIVRVPPRIVKKGSVIELQGAIVQEISANNDSIVELSNMNVSKQDTHTSSWTSVEVRYFINNNGYNSVVHPMIQTNYSEIAQYTDPDGNVLWQKQQRWANNTSYTQPNILGAIGINLISGFNVNTSQRQDYNFQNSGIYALKPTVDFVKFDSTIAHVGSSYYGDWDIPNPVDIYNDLGNGNIYNFALQGAVGIRTALKRNQPNGDKYTYIKPGFKGFIAYDMSEETGIPDVEIYTKNIIIDLKNNLMETADEIALLINSKLQGDTFNATNNNVKVMSKFRQWSTDYIKKYPNSDVLYPENSDKEVVSITSDTLINIPCNFQNNEEHKIFGDGLFVKDAERFVYGCGLFKMNKKFTKFNGSFQVVKGIDPVVFRPYLNDFDTLYRGGTNSTFPSIEYPATIAVSLQQNDPVYEPFEFDNTDPNLDIEWVFTNLQPDNILPGNGFLRFKKTNPDLTIINDDVDYIYGVEWSYNGNTQQEYFISSYDDYNGNLSMNLYEADIIGGKYVQTSPIVIFRILLDNSILNGSTMNITSLSNSKTYELINEKLDLRTNLLLSFAQNKSVNGLPYYGLVGNTGGGQYGTDNIDLDPVINEYLCLPDKFVIPMNVKIYNDNNNLSIILDKITKFFRNNETYIGNYTDNVAMEKDTVNWICDLDIGLACDFNNAQSNWLSSKGKDNPNEDTTDYTIYDEQSNYSIYGHFCPNVMSIEQYDIKGDTQTGIPLPNGYNFRRPLTIYPISRYAKMGCNDYTTSENYIKVYSRFNSQIITGIKGSNHNMNVNFDENHPPQRLHPLLKIEQYDPIIYNYCQSNNIPLVGCKYLGSDYMSFGFINYNNTFKGDGTGIVDYNYETENYRTCFRICSLTNVGYDCASTTNPYASAMNRNQSVPTNPDFFTSEFYGAQSTIIPNEEVGQYTYGDNTNPIFSPRIEDYTNFIYIGGSPQIKYDRSRMIFTAGFQPRRFNSNDAEGSADPNIGSNIAMLNDRTMMYNCLNCSIGTVPATIPAPGPYLGVNQVPVRGAPAFYQQIQNKGIVDSLSGVGINNLYTRNEETVNTEPGQDGVYLCKINIDNTTENYNKSFFNLLGFSLRQFKPYYGRSYQRYSRHNYNSTNNLKYNGINYFTLNAFVNQTNMQNINVYGPNYNIIDPSPPLPVPYYPNSIRGQPQLMNGYVGFNNQNIQVQTDELRGETVPSKLQQSFYKITSSLPSGSYITNNNNLNVCSYFYRNYKNSSFYFTYSSGTNITLTEDILLSSVRTQILGENNRSAEHLGQSAVVFYKITETRQLQTLDEDDIKLLSEIQKNPENGVLQFNEPLDNYQQAEINSININNSLNVSVGENITYGEDIINENPEMLVPMPETKTEEIVSEMSILERRGLQNLSINPYVKRGVGRPVKIPITEKINKTEKTFETRGRPIKGTTEGVERVFKTGISDLVDFLQQRGIKEKDPQFKKILKLREEFEEPSITGIKFLETQAEEARKTTTREEPGRREAESREAF